MVHTASMRDSSASEVTVMFEDAALMFALPEGATLEDLATCLAGLEQRHFGEKLSIDVRLRH
jgi:hypothetical protein